MAQNEGLLKIINERFRQQEKCGWTHQHDADEHGCGELARQAISLLLNQYGDVDGSAGQFDHFEITHKDKFKGIEGRLRSLVVAGALIAAEIDRVIAEKSSLESFQGRETDDE